MRRHLVAAVVAACATASPAPAEPLVAGRAAPEGPVGGRVGGAGIDYAAARRAADALAQLAVARGDPIVLLGALRALLATGAGDAPDDPWETPRLIAEAVRLVGDDLALRALLAGLGTRAKGALDGPIRHDLTLAPGAELRFEYLAAADEVMDVEVRLKRDSAGADLDVSAFDADGRLVDADAGPETGGLGVGAYVRWVPETCARFTVVVTNVGPREARFALLAAPSSTRDCNARTEGRK